MNGPHRGLLPQRRGPGAALALALVAAALLARPPDAVADEVAVPEPNEALATTARLDGTYLALGPVAAATRVAATWDSAFGGELLAGHIDERRAVSAVGLAVGGVAFGERSGGRVWADLLLATSHTPLLAVGLAAGPVAEVPDVGRARLGAQGTIFAFSGVMPYLRLGRVSRSGTFVELGVRLPLPALRWR